MLQGSTPIRRYAACLRSAQHGTPPRITPARRPRASHSLAGQAAPGPPPPPGSRTHSSPPAWGALVRGGIGTRCSRRSIARLSGIEAGRPRTRHAACAASSTSRGDMRRLHTLRSAAGAVDGSTPRCESRQTSARQDSPQIARRRMAIRESTPRRSTHPARPARRVPRSAPPKGTEAMRPRRRRVTHCSAITRRRCRRPAASRHQRRPPLVRVGAAHPAPNPGVSHRTAMTNRDPRAAARKPSSAMPMPRRSAPDHVQRAEGHPDPGSSVVMVRNQMQVAADRFSHSRTRIAVATVLGCRGRETVPVEPGQSSSMLCCALAASSSRSTSCREAFAPGSASW